MKPEYLKFEAFGPYLSETEIDFSQLHETSLFLISGPTGGGKTTILDAMCFALYCKATGGKRDFKSMRCNSADYETPTVVEFVFSLGERKYKFLRSRFMNKNRNTKEYAAKEKHECFVQTDGEWQLLESGSETAVRRQAEELLHLTCEQFSQVIVLPQGEFLKLLRASSKEKGEMFVTLFDVELWRRIMENAAKRLRKLEEESRESFLARETLLKQEGCGDEKEVQEQLAVSKAQRETANQRSEQIKKETVKLSESVAQTEEFLRLEARKNETETAKQNAEKAFDISEKQLNENANMPKLEEKERKQATELGKMAVQLKEQRALFMSAANARKNMQETQKNTEEKKEVFLKCEETLVQKEERMQKGNSFVIGIQELADKCPLYMEKVSEFEKILEEFAKADDKKKKADSLKAEVKRLENSVTKKKIVIESLSKEVKAQEEIRKKNIALVLAQSLEDETPCPVCGALHHPEPAHGGRETMDRREYEKLQLTLKNAEEAFKVDSHMLGVKKEELLQAKKEEAAQIEAVSKLTESRREKTETQANDWKKKLEEARKAAAQLKKAKEELEKISNEKEACRKKMTDIQAELSGLKAELKTQERNLTEIEKRLPDISLEDLEEKIMETEKGEVACQELAEKYSKTYQQVLTKYTEAKTVLQAAVEAQIAAKQAFEACESKLKEELPDLQKMKEQHEALQKEALECSRVTGQAEMRVQAMEKVLQKLNEFSEKLEKLEKDLAFAEKLSKSLSGTNIYKTPILQFVLSVMLDEILVSANHFFSVLSRGRYALMRVTEQKGGNNLRGLDMEVMDGYSMTNRSIETLSGGEQFLASMSLAFGLSDVVQKHSGAVRLDSLFIDEGFGSLDTETLELAMKALQTLQQSGRIVGMISHVSELKNRISARIEISRDKAGASKVSIKN